jgi:hypothetical protein
MLARWCSRGFVACLVLIGIGCAPALAGSLTIPATAGGSSLGGGTSGWTVTWGDNQNGNDLKLRYDARNKTLYKIVTFTKNSDVTIDFAEKPPLPAKDVDPDEGLRIRVVELITNETGKTWDSFLMKLNDQTPIDPKLVKDPDGKKSGHPIVPHFHLSDKPVFAPFKPEDFGGKDKNMWDVNLQLGGGRFASDPNVTETWSGFVIHDREVQKDHLPKGQGFRKFQLIETPHAAAAPEPSSVALFALGIIGVLGYRWRRRGRSRF